uniref:Anaphase-promoting complex subunit 4-like WD40 domain-containing protein n=1 Tax=Panagrolaimus superbus TaxID=310955 RepID=A0A914Y6K4_9BILA
MNVGTARNQYLPPHGGNRNRAANIPETIRQFNKSIDPSNSEVNRVYPTSSDHYLNGLGLVTKYYYNIIDWSPKNFIAVALLEKVFIINVATTGADLFKDFNSNTYVVTSLKFSKDGALLAVGFENGFMHIFTVDTKQLVRKFNAEVRGIGSVAWTSGGLLSYGNCNGRIQTHDTRQHVSLLSETRHHGNKVCALNWVCNDKYLVSGSSDYIVNVYSKDTIIRQDPVCFYLLFIAVTFI